MMNKAFYLTICECYFLLMQRNLKGIIFFKEISEYMPNNQSIASAVISLINKDILRTLDGKSYVLAEELNIALDVVENAQATFIEQGYRAASPMRCMYFFQKLALTIQMDDLHKGYVRIELLSDEDAVRELSDYDFMPDIHGYEVQEYDALDEDVLKELKHLVFGRTMGECLKEKAILMAIERIPKGMQILDMRIFIIAWDGRDFLVVDTKESMDVKRYSLKRFVDTLMEAKNDIS